MQDEGYGRSCVQQGGSGPIAQLHNRLELASEVRSAERSCSLPVGRVSVMNSCSTIGVTITSTHSMSSECAAMPHMNLRGEGKRQEKLGATGIDCDLVNLAPCPPLHPQSVQRMPSMSIMSKAQGARDPVGISCIRSTAADSSKGYTTSAIGLSARMPGLLPARRRAAARLTAACLGAAADAVPG